MNIEQRRGLASLPTVLLVALMALLLSLFMAGCSGLAPTPTPNPTSTPTPKPTATLTALPQPLELVVLHTNDTLGYTEPCG